MLVQAIRLLLLWFFSAATFAEKPDVLPIYAYHADPPFVISNAKRTGINYDFISALQKAQPGLTIEYRYRDRKTINALLKAGEPMIVMWTNPAWFENSEAYLWTRSLFWDKDIVVSRSTSDFQFNSIGDLAGLRLGGREGYHYNGLENAKVTRVDAVNDQDNIQQLLDYKVDVIIISKSSFLYYVRNLQLYNKVKILGNPLTKFQRKLLVSTHYKGFFPSLDASIGNIIQQNSWHNRVMLYGLHDLYLEPQN